MDVYDRSYDEKEYNLSRKEAMFNFYIIDQGGKRLKNMDALLFLYLHVGEFSDFTLEFVNNF